MNSIPNQTSIVTEIDLEPALAADSGASASGGSSWVFQFFDFVRNTVENGLGIASIIFCTAIAANIPIVQFLSFGYLLEVSGRLARGGTIKDSLVGVTKAFKIGVVLLGTWLLLIPIRFFSDAYWYDAYLIDPASDQTRWMRYLQFLFIGLTLLQIGAAWVCGGKFRYFFWQLVAPFSFGIWLFRKLLGSRFTRPILNFVFKWISPNLVNDLCNAQPPADWFVPAILWKKIQSGSFYTEIRDGLWNFVFSLNLWHYFKLGFVGFVGSAIWLALPTALLIGATRLTGGSAILCAVTGVITAIPVFVILLYQQTHFAREQKLSSFWQPGVVLANFRRAPIAHVVALLLALIFAIPLFILKIEQIPAELLWLLSIVFVLFSWPSRIAIGLAYRRGTRKTESGRWWIRWAEMMMAIPIAALFVLVLSLTRYVSWHGAFSMIENHVFLLPAPFWL